MRRTRAGLMPFRPVRPGARVAVVAPASSFDRLAFEAGLAELTALGFLPVVDERVFERGVFTAGSVATRVSVLGDAWARADVDAIVAVRGGYGSMELLPHLDFDAIRASRTAFVGYSDVTSLHTCLAGLAGLTSVHGVMLEGRLAAGPAAYDRDTFLRAWGAAPLGELAPPGIDVVRPGDASGPLFGGTLTQLLASFGTPFEFRPPAGHVLLLDEIGERPYRLHRMLTQWRQAGRFAHAAAVVVGQLPKCDEPDGSVTARSVVADVLADFPGPVLFGFPTGHTTTPLVSLPLGVETRVVAGARPCLVVEEAAAAE